MLLQEASRTLPDEVVRLLKSKPPEERLQLLRALVQVCALMRGPPATKTREG